MRDSLDRFYTNIDVASHCIDILTDAIGEPLLDYVVESSAGSGSFSALLRARGSHVIAFDIAPNGDEVSYPRLMLLGFLSRDSNFSM